MATKIRLQRHGRKKKPFFWIIVTDSRAKRDGKFIEKIGTYNPVTDPAQVELNRDAAVSWLHKGAQPTETARRLLSYKGALMQHHLEVGVKKGAFSQEQAEEKLNKWLEEKAERIDLKVKKISSDKEATKAKKIQSEKQYREDKISQKAESTSESEEVETSVEKESAPETKEATVEETKDISKSDAPTSKEEDKASK